MFPETHDPIPKILWTIPEKNIMIPENKYKDSGKKYVFPEINHSFQSFISGKL